MFEAKPFSTALNVAVLTVANRLFPTGFDVGSDAPETLTDLVGLIEQTGRMKVSDQNCEGTIFGSPEVNMAFRAWHDWCHWQGRYAFTLEGEIQAFEMQIDHLKTLGLWSEEIETLMYIEVVEQASFYEATGEFPTDQRSFTRQALHDYGKSIPAHATAYSDHLLTCESNRTMMLASMPSPEAQVARPV